VLIGDADTLVGSWPVGAEIEGMLVGCGNGAKFQIRVRYVSTIVLSYLSHEYCHPAFDFIITTVTIIINPISITAVVSVVITVADIVTMIES
jgi:hypothetical protein